MNIIDLKDFRSRREHQRIERRACEFLIEAWNSAVENEQRLPTEMALSLIHRIMLDHGLTFQDIIERYDCEFD
jgi:hypothetical protein